MGTKWPFLPVAGANSSPAPTSRILPTIPHLVCLLHRDGQWVVVSYQIMWFIMKLVVQCHGCLLARFSWRHTLWKLKWIPQSTSKSQVGLRALENQLDPRFKLSRINTQFWGFLFYIYEFEACSCETWVQLQLEGGLYSLTNDPFIAAFKIRLLTKTVPILFILFYFTFSQRFILFIYTISLNLIF